MGRHHRRNDFEIAERRCSYAGVAGACTRCEIPTSQPVTALLDLCEVGDSDGRSLLSSPSGSSSLSPPSVSVKSSLGNKHSGLSLAEEIDHRTHSWETSQSGLARDNEVLVNDSPAPAPSRQIFPSSIRTPQGALIDLVVVASPTTGSHAAATALAWDQKAPVGVTTTSSPTPPSPDLPYTAHPTSLLEHQRIYIDFITVAAIVVLAHYLVSSMCALSDLAYIRTGLWCLSAL